MDPFHSADPWCRAVYAVDATGCAPILSADHGPAADPDLLAASHTSPSCCSEDSNTTDAEPQDFPATTSPAPAHKNPAKKMQGAKPATGEQLSRRREQNRNSQKAYRERKDRRIKELEVEVAKAQQTMAALLAAYGELRLECENFRKKQSQAHIVDFATSAVGANPVSTTLTTTRGLPGEALSWDERGLAFSLNLAPIYGTYQA